MTLRKPSGIVIYGIGALVVALGVLVYWRLALPQRTSLEVQIVSPQPDAAGVIELDTPQMFECRWKLTNNGNSAIRNLKVGASCQCQISAGPPDELLAGRSAEIGVRLTSPRAGRGTRFVPTFASGSSEPLAILKATINVRVTPPSWMIPPTTIELRGVAGQDQALERIWEVIEKRSAKRWIDRIECDDRELLSLEWSHEETNFGDDNEIILRKYRVVMHPRANAALKQSTTLRFVGGTGIELAAVPVVVEILPLFAAIPAAISLPSDSGPQRITVLRRDPDQSDLTTQFDQQLLEVSLVKSIDRGPLVFEVSRRQDAVNVPQGTPVTFYHDQVEVVKVNVRFP